MIAAALGALAILVGVIEPSEIGPIYFNPVIGDSAVFTWTLDANHCRYGSMSSGAAGGFIIGDAGYQDKLSIALHGEFRSKINFPSNRTGNHAFPLREGNGANVIDKFAYIEGGQTTSIRPEAQVHSWILGQQFYWRHNTINFIYGKNCDGGFVPNIRYIISNVRSYIFPVDSNVLNRDRINSDPRPLLIFHFTHGCGENVPLGDSETDGCGGKDSYRDCRSGCPIRGAPFGILQLVAGAFIIGGGYWGAFGDRGGRRWPFVIAAVIGYAIIAHGTLSILS